MFGQIPFTSQLNMTGQPAVSLPLGVSSDGLPIGVQLAAQALREDVLVQVSAQLEAAMPWAERRPAVRGGDGDVAAVAVRDGADTLPSAPAKGAAHWPRRSRVGDAGSP